MINLLLFTLIIYFFSPSSYLSDNFPVRVSDLALLLGLIPLTYLIGKNIAKINVGVPIMFYILFLCSMILSFVINASDANILFIFKMLSYIFFYFVGQILFINNFNLNKVVVYFLGISLITLIIYPIEANSIWETVDRITLTFIGPYNVGLVFAMVFFMDKNFYFKFVSLIFVLLSGSRTMLIATIVYELFERIISKSRLAIPLSLIFILGAMSFISVSENNRLVNGLSKAENTFLIAMDNSIHRNPTATKFDYENILFHTRGDRITDHSKNGVEIDFSLYLRFMTWFDVLRNNLQNNSNFLFGMGPGFYESSTDGSYVRIFGENGILGLSLYILFLLYSYKYLKVHDKQGVVIMFAVSGLMIDTFYSSIGVPFLLIILGFVENIPQKKVNET